MKPRLSFATWIDTLAHAQTIRDNVAAELVGKDIFEQHDLSAVDLGGGDGILAHGDIRFNSGTDRDTVRSWIQAQIAEHPVVKTWVYWIEVTWHECPHDEGGANCQATRWVRGNRRLVQ
jgi:hypothetical protein